MSDTEISMLDHCTDRQLKELLALASTSVRATRNWLLEIGDSERLEHLLTEMCTGTEQSGGALLRAVRSADTPVEALVAIKSVAKRLALTAEAPAQNACCHTALPLVGGIRAGASRAKHLLKGSGRAPASVSGPGGGVVRRRVGGHLRNGRR